MFATMSTIDCTLAGDGVCGQGKESHTVVGVYRKSPLSVEHRASNHAR